MTGTLYAVGVGPGDPELMTVKAVRRMMASQVIAIPHTDPKCCTAYAIAAEAVPEIKKKPVLCIGMPMTKEEDRLEKCHEEGAEKIAEALREGNHVALLTLGDSTVYASSMYLVERVRKKGYEAEIVSGIPSFCAAAARIGISLAEKSEELHILPGTYGIEEGLKLPGVKVLMKMGKKYPQIAEALKQGNYQVSMAENCGMEDERIYHGAEELPKEAGYYSLMIVRDKDV